MDTRVLYEEQLFPVAHKIGTVLLESVDIDPEFQEMYRSAVGGGMRFRPCLMYIAFAMCGGEAEEVMIPSAVAVELLHKASLLHDDLVDGDALRRGTPSFCHIHGSEKAVIMGDLLVARAYLAMGGLEGLVPGETAKEARKRFVAAHRDMCRGELLELMPVAGALTIDHAVRVLQGKTAALMEQSLAIGAVLGGGSALQVEALGEYGRCLGFIFQTVNDMNNLTGFDSTVKGSSLGDLARRRVGFPMVGLAMYLGEERLAALADQARSGRDGAAKAQVELEKLMKEGPVRDWLDGILEDLGDRALRALSVFPSSFEKHALESVGREMFESWFWEPDKRDEEV
ncbi:MAG: polyprenyl synthetase family protein [Firmicutes bacterium]|jgi:geranylgeranyl pyrophosphate synthase|nr:polyprenyl synthetase family protein [Bacillota bacterium]MDD4337422.1 polyprenyl synthetase family protein [Bacillota bacterium]MDD4791986.1 polyprenyl synthetase family protein [Bacillota bacterium]